MLLPLLEAGLSHADGGPGWCALRPCSWLMLSEDFWRWAEGVTEGRSVAEVLLMDFEAVAAD